MKCTRISHIYVIYTYTQVRFLSFLFFCIVWVYFCESIREGNRYYVYNTGLEAQHLPDRHIDGLVQGRPNSIANALELRFSCTNPSIWGFLVCLIGGHCEIGSTVVWMKALLSFQTLPLETPKNVIAIHLNNLKTVTRKSKLPWLSRALKMKFNQLNLAISSKRCNAISLSRQPPHPSTRNYSHYSTPVGHVINCNGSVDTEYDI